jgi:Bacterial Ig domain
MTMRQPATSTHIFSRVRRNTWALTWVTCGLLACAGGGGGGADPIPATANAVADNFTVTWNSERRLAVLDNDSSSGGTPALSLAAAPKNGSVSISAGVLSYTPKTGYFGADEFQYTLAVGNASSTATVKLVVEADITLQGLVTAGQTTAAVSPSATNPFANAKVQASVGSKNFSVDADALGRYSLPIKTSSASDFVALTGTAVGAQSKLVLTSLAGEVSGLAAAAKDGKLSSDQAPALLISHVSAAQAGLMAQAGKLPGNNNELSAAAAKLNQFAAADAAALVGLVASANVALPAALTSTRELLESPAQLSSFDAAQRLANAAQLTTLRESIYTDPLLSTAPPTPTAANTSTQLLYANGQGGAAYAISLITLRADGSATILTDDTTRSAKWQLQNKVVQLTYDTPFVLGGGRNDDETFDDVYTGVTYTDIGPSQGGYGLAGSRTIRHRLITNGGRRGQKTDISYGDFTRRYTLNGEAFKAEEFASGVRIAGPFSSNPGPDAGFVQAQDILRITGPGTGVMERTGAAASWQLLDGALRVSVGNFSAHYRRLGLGPLGEERWTMEFLDTAGQATGLLEIMAVRASPVTLTAADWAKPWRGNLQDGWGVRLTYDLKTDGSWFIISSDRETPEPTSSVKRYWRPSPDGRLDMAGGARQCNPFASANCVITQQRYWTVVGRSGKTLWVIEEGPYFINPDTTVQPSFRLVAFTDPSTGP